jgi:hypothetical protein
LTASHVGKVRFMIILAPPHPPPSKIFLSLSLSLSLSPSSQRCSRAWKSCRRVCRPCCKAHRTCYRIYKRCWKRHEWRYRARVQQQQQQLRCIQNQTSGSSGGAREEGEERLAEDSEGESEGLGSEAQCVFLLSRVSISLNLP